MSATLLSLLDHDLAGVVGGAEKKKDERSGLELAYDRGKACVVGALAAQKALPPIVPPYVKAAIGCTAGVAEQVRQEGGFNLEKPTKP